ncbi:thioredoxin family protein [Amycolatopsis rhizosphaerae]|uniref:Thioredoxin family protein n=1 Tax=Amycolatopsis rhizosphaerae TaxID=2053003 RepID=A0A558DE09_9PSEU|nr:thioredoxin family protein [Amycolatopsis rhizosphaerae]TVT59269.1 thioredoxin family protein [Amycolatopsis rhizosphaerae]
MTGLWVVAGVVVLGLFAGALRYAREGRIRAAKKSKRALPAPVAEVIDPAGRVTLVQVSASFCAPCRHAKAVLAPLAGRTEGLTHVELDVTDQPEVARALGVLRTPTTIAFTPDGTELLRVSGVPKGEEVLAALGEHLPAADSPATRLT